MKVKTHETVTSKIYGYLKMFHLIVKKYGSKIKSILKYLS